MKKSTVKLVILLIFSVLLTGCRSTPQQGISRSVTGITITYKNGQIQTMRQYTTSTKMRAILNYLRWIDPYGKPEADPEKIEGSLFQIVLTFSDSSEKVYLQKADRYMQIDGKQWQTIDPERALTLSKMLGEMESDEA